MNPNFKVQDIDGCGDRGDIALARDKQQMQILENKEREIFEKGLAIDRAKEWATNSFSKPITTIIKEMIENECYGKLLLKSDIEWDVETISEATTEACIQLGLSDEDFSPSYHDQGNEINIRLF